MTKIFVATESRLIVVEAFRDPPKSMAKLVGTSPQCVAVDPSSEDTVFCGTFGQGLWRSRDAGSNWDRMTSLRENAVMALAVSDRGVVYAGTEPSAVFRSDDAGESWRRLEAFDRLPSSATWSFPPRPETHHVRWIGIDPSAQGRIYAAVEAGALVRSLDGGETWIDRVRDSPYDTHTLRTHSLAKGRLFSAAGDGYFESLDYGDSWESPEDGLRHRYLHGLALDPGDAHTVVVSAASGPWSAHNASQANSVIYRKTRGSRWELISDGLPDRQGTIVSSITSGRSSGELYLANNRGIYSSVDGGLTWNGLKVAWPEACTREHAWAIAIGGEG